MIGAMLVDPGLFDDLTARGLVHDTTDREALIERLREPITVYVGFDPTADSLHVGNMIGLMTLRRFQDAGHHVISLAGGATGMIGDPSGKSDERNLLDDDGLAANLAGIVPQLKQFLDFDRDTNPAKLLDNRAWTVGVSYLEFLRDVGKHVTVNQMVAKESVKNRMQGDQGISYTEFSYMLLQGHDFAWLHENEGCEMQMGGSDQWGNIVLGADLVRRRSGKPAFALTWPLLTKPDGSKYGKTAGGDTMWLGAHRMSPYRFYQGWMQSDDGDLFTLLAQLTLLSVDEVNAVVEAHEAEPHRRIGQRRLAAEITALVHGEAAAAGAEAASSVIFGGAVADLDVDALEMLAGEVPSAAMHRSDLGEEGNLVDLLVGAEIAASKGEANRLLNQNGVSLNDAKVAPDTVVSTDHVLCEKFILIRKGKKHVSLVRLEG